ncbi:MAG: nucleotide pyrophosphohydrolase [Bacillota bacterium]
MAGEDRALTLREWQDAVDRQIRGYRVKYFSPLSNLARLTEEVGELARELNHRFGEKPKKPEEAEGSVLLELGDILYVVVCLANSLHLDLDEALSRVMEKYRTRDRNRWGHAGEVPEQQDPAPGEAD